MFKYCSLNLLLLNTNFPLSTHTRREILCCYVANMYDAFLPWSSQSWMSCLCTGVDVCKKDCMNEIRHIAVQIFKSIIQESKHVCVFVFPTHSELTRWDGEAVTTVCSARTLLILSAFKDRAKGKTPQRRTHLELTCWMVATHEHPAAETWNPGASLAARHRWNSNSHL